MKLKQFKKNEENQVIGKTITDRKVQANKSIRRMPWHQEPMKDVISCDKLRGTANRYRSVDFRMGEPGWAIPSRRALNQ